MAIAYSKLTAQGQISVPTEVRRRLGIGPGSVLEWEEDGERMVIRRAGRYTSEDVHRALFEEEPDPVVYNRPRRSETMARYTRRAQVLLTEDQYRSLQTLAEAEEKPLGVLLREAAEEVYFREKQRGQKARAARELLALPGTDVPKDYQEWERQYLDQRVETHG